MPQITFGNDQMNAIRMAGEWANSPLLFQKPVFVIGGYAGTGKSTVLSQILYNMGIPMYKVAFATFTGKAAVVLRRKGMNAITIHKLIYITSSSKSGRPCFRLKRNLPPNVELICIDELGMVPQEIMDDIVSFHIPILGLGDPGQLPPVFGKNVYMDNPDCFLTEVFRQSGDSSLLQIATDIRNGINPYEQKYADDVKISDSVNFKGDIRSFDQILCSSNRNRRDINVKYRELLGKQTPLPTAGEKVICQLNNFNEVYTYDESIDVCLVNGLTGTLIDDAIEVSENVIFFRFKPDGMNMEIPVFSKRQTFMDNYVDWEIVKEKKKQLFQVEIYNGKMVNDFDYGYCITCHKSQGSEWDNVLVYDDCFYHDDQNYRRWLYTAVTRAKKQVTVVKVDT